MTELNAAVSSKCKMIKTTHLNAPHFPIGLFPVGEHLPQCNSVAPYITLMTERAIVVGLWCVPLNRPLASTTRFVI